MDDAPLSLYGIPLYINTLQVMLDDGAVHTALCRKKKRRNRALPPGPAQQLLYSIYSPAKVYLIAIHSSFWDQQSANSVGDSPIPQNKKKRRNERRNHRHYMHRHYMHHHTPVKRGFVSGFTESV